MGTWADTASKPAPFAQPEADAALAQWLDERCGHLTASRMNDAMGFLKNGNPSAKRTSYMYDLLAERLTGISTRHYVNSAMEWGLATEPEAKLVYAKLTGHKLGPAEFITHPTIPNFGATPDSILLGEKGLLEVKCPTTATFIEWKIAGVIPEEHKPQMTVQAVCAKREWVDFFAYDPRIKEEKNRHLLLRYHPTDGDIEKVEDAAVRFLDELDEMFNQFVTATHA